MKTYPELNATNPSEQFTGRWAFTFRSGASFDLAYLATTLVAATDLRQYLGTLPEWNISPGLHSDADALDDPYSFDTLPDLDALAQAQGVLPPANVAYLATHDWPENESVEDFIAAATEGRYEEDEPDS